MEFIDDDNDLFLCWLVGVGTCRGVLDLAQKCPLELGIHLYSHLGSANSRGCFLSFVKIIIVHKYQLSRITVR